jgi:hypothetical protein
MLDHRDLDEASIKSKRPYSAKIRPNIPKSQDTTVQNMSTARKKVNKIQGGVFYGKKIVFKERKKSIGNPFSVGLNVSH